MSLRALTSVWDASTQEGGPLLVMLALADNANDQMVAYPSVPTIARKSRLSERQVRRILRDLEQAGEIKVIGKGRNNVNKYLLTPSMATETVGAPAHEGGQNVRASSSSEPGQNVTPSADKPGQIVRARGDTKPGHGVRADMDVRASPDIAVSAEPSSKPSDVVVVVARDALNLKRETLDRMEADLTLAVGEAFSRTSLGIHDLTLPILWLERGDDWQLDILPSVKFVADASLAREGPGKINSWKYFDRAIAAARYRREHQGEADAGNYHRKTAGNQRSRTAVAAVLASGDREG